MLTLVTWNLNSLRARLPLVLRYLEQHTPDVVCLQETRVANDAFPREQLGALGYHAATLGSGSYAGVAILSRAPIDEVVAGLEGFTEEREAGRRLMCRIGELWVDTVYVPTRKKIGKIAFLDALGADHRRRFAQDDVIVCGDLNICWDRRDLASPKMIADADIHPDRPEDQAFRRLVESCGWVDCFRALCDEPGHHSWFPLTRWALKRNYGMRLDYVFATAAVAETVREVVHDIEPRSWDRPSDHVPIRASFEH